MQASSSRWPLAGMEAILLAAAWAFFVGLILAARVLKR